MEACLLNKGYYGNNNWVLPCKHVYLIKAIIATKNWVYHGSMFIEKGYYSNKKYKHLQLRLDF
jgi:hypothetical protein